jgi:hypothetical protein
MLPHPRRHLDDGVSLMWRTSRDGDDDERRAVLAFLDGHDHHHRPVLDAFLAAFLRLAMPEIDVRENVSRSRDRP